MLGEYDSFVHHLRLCGDVVCGRASSTMFTGGDERDACDGVPVWQVALVTTTGADAATMCSSRAAAADPNGTSAVSTSSPPSLNLAAVTAPGSSSRATRDTLLALITNFHQVFVGSMNYDALKALANLDVDIPSSAFLPLLHQAVRSTAITAAGAGAERLCTLTLGRVAPTTSAGVSAPSRDAVLVVDIRGALRRRFSLPLTPLEMESQRKLALSFLCANLMMSHAQVSHALERERLARREVDERLQAALAMGSTGPSSAAGGGGGTGANNGAAVASNARKIQRPPSLVNPQAKGPQKRPRGVKFS